jgi:hypothetical protein
VTAEPAVSDVIVVLGFGETGSLIARDLVAAGAVVRGGVRRVAGRDASGAIWADLNTAAPRVK